MDNHNDIRIVNILPCKECGHEEGIELKDEVTLAECSICQHLSDVKEPIDDNLIIKGPYNIKDYYPHQNNIEDV